MTHGEEGYSAETAPLINQNTGLLLQFAIISSRSSMEIRVRGKKSREVKILFPPPTIKKGGEKKQRPSTQVRVPSSSSSPLLQRVSPRRCSRRRELRVRRIGSPVAPPDHGSIGHEEDCDARPPSSPFRTRSTAPAQLTSIPICTPPPNCLTDVM